MCEKSSYYQEYREKEPLETIGCLEKGSFSYKVTQSINIENRYRIIEFKSIEEIFEAVEQGIINKGLVPGENSSDGEVKNTMQKFLNSNSKIEEQHILRVKHYAYWRTDSEESDHTIVCSKDTALKQCLKYINKEGLLEEPVDSTISGVRRASEEKNVVGIGSENAGENFTNLTRSPDSIEDNPNNITTFWIITKSEEIQKPTGNDKTSIILSVKNSPGELYEALENFKKINLNRIKSIGTTGEYVQFFLSFDGHEKNSDIFKILEEKKAEEKIDFRKLGSYPKPEYTPVENQIEDNLEPNIPHISKKILSERGIIPREEKYLLVSVPNKKESLAKVLESFKSQNINLMSIDSQPNGYYEGEEILFSVSFEKCEKETELRKNLLDMNIKVYDLLFSEK